MNKKWLLNGEGIDKQLIFYLNNFENLKTEGMSPKLYIDYLVK
jgi:hypothetical protein